MRVVEILLREYNKARQWRLSAGAGLPALGMMQLQRASTSPPPAMWWCPRCLTIEIGESVGRSGCAFLRQTSSRSATRLRSNNQGEVPAPIALDPPAVRPDPVGEVRAGRRNSRARRHHRAAAGDEGGAISSSRSGQDHQGPCRRRVPVLEKPATARRTATTPSRIERVLNQQVSWIGDQNA